MKIKHTWNHHPVSKFVLFVFCFSSKSTPSVHHFNESTPPPFLQTNPSGTEQLPYWLCEVLEQFSPISPFDSAERCFFQRSNLFPAKQTKNSWTGHTYRSAIGGKFCGKIIFGKKKYVEKVVMTLAKRPTPKSDLQFNTSKFGHLWHAFGFVTMWAFKLRNPNTPLTCLFGQFAMVVRYGFVWWIWVIV